MVDKDGWNHCFWSNYRTKIQTSDPFFFCLLQMKFDFFLLIKYLTLNSTTTDVIWSELSIMMDDLILSKRIRNVERNFIEPETSLDKYVLFYLCIFLIVFLIWSHPRATASDCWGNVSTVRFLDCITTRPVQLKFWTEHAHFIKINRILPASTVNITMKTRLITCFIQGFAPHGMLMPLV